MEDASASHPLTQPAAPNPTATPPIPPNPVEAFLGEETFRRFPPTRNKSLTLHDVPMDFEGLKVLAENDLWKEVLKLCERNFQVGFAPQEVLQYRLAHLVALLKLRLYEFAGAQCDSLGNLQKNASYFYESYPSIYRDKTGNMVPFSLEVIKALVPQLRGDGKKAQDELYRLLFRCICEMQRIDPANAHMYGILKPSKRVVEMRRNRHHQQHANAEMAVFDSSKGGANRQQAGESQPQKQAKSDAAASLPSSSSSAATETEANNDDILDLWKLREKRVLFLIVNCHIVEAEYHLALQLMEKALAYWGPDLTLQSLLGALYLQAGIVFKAKDVFSQEERMVRDQQRDPNSDVLCCLNRGFVHFAESKYEEALAQFDYILSELDDTNVVAANCKSVCLLFLRRLSDAIRVLEDIIKKNPPKALTETLVYNLCTLYDLESDQSLQKKRIIRSLVLRYCGDDFPIHALKLV